MAETVISQEIINEFENLTYEELVNLDYIDLFNQLETIKKEFILNNQKKKFEIVKGYVKFAQDTETLTKEEGKILFKAYQIIQIIRQKITGETLTYRLYITSDTTARFINIGGEKLENFLSFGGEDINILASRVQEEINKNNNQTKFESQQQKFFEKKYSLVMNHFEKTKSNNLYKVKEENSPPPKIIKQKNRPNSPQVYTRGHISEALDKTLTKYAVQLNEGYKVSNNEILNDFSNYLDYDNVSGFRGGDNAMVQIKANSARLMRYTSILNAINRILKIRDIIQNQYSRKGTANSTKNLKKRIRMLYENSNANDTINKVTDENIDKFIKELIKGFAQKQEIEI